MDVLIHSIVYSLIYYGVYIRHILNIYIYIHIHIIVLWFCFPNSQAQVHGLLDMITR
jgi:hypothetical protein